MTTLSEALTAYRICARAEGKSPRTMEWVTSSVGYFIDFLGSDMDIGYATLKRLLDARLQVLGESAGEMLALAAITTHGDLEACNDVLATPLTKSLNAYS